MVHSECIILGQKPDEDENWVCDSCSFAFEDKIDNAKEAIKFVKSIT